MTARMNLRPGHKRLANRLGLRSLAGFLCCLLPALLATAVYAQRSPAAPAVPAKTPAPQATVSGPAWTELTPGQQSILQPLATTWNSLRQGQRRKWLQMTKSYPSLSAEDQAKMQGRMREWVALSPQQRTQARLNFARTKELSRELSPEEKKAKWQAYQALSDEEKRKLAAKAPPKPAGAAPAAKPVAVQKLATVPSRPDRPKAKPAPKMAVAQPQAGRPAVPTVPTPAKP